jgi:aldose 1-epimerase
VEELSVSRAPFGRLPDGREVDVFTLTNAGGVEVRAITYGGVIVSLRVPDRSGHVEDVVLGYDDLGGYLEKSPYFGAVVGRFANRIAGGRFTLDGRAHQLTINEPPNHLHGGGRGFDKGLWKAEERAGAHAVSVTFRHDSPSGEEGYPGRVAAAVTYTLTEAAELIVEYEATTDAPTIVNLTQHTYFNLAGAGSGDILGHTLAVWADDYLPVDATMIPTGEVASVTDTPFDFRQETLIGTRIGEAHPQLAHGAGYDHTFVIRRGAGDLVPAARLVDPRSGRSLDVRTTAPGLQVYSGNRLDGTIRGKSGRVYPVHGGISLETQHFPDAPNHPAFPSAVLRPGQDYRSTTVFAFGVC